MNANERRILAKLWKDRHTHPGGELQEIEQRLIRVETGLDPVATQSGAHLHLLGGSQTVDAEAIDWDALLALPLATAIPAFPTSEVTISQGGYYPFYVDVTFDGWHQGGDIWITRTRGGDTSQVWPPPGASDLWSSPGGSRFTDIAPAIDCEPGDVYQLWVDCGEEVTVKRAVFVPWLADRGVGGGFSGDLLVFTESGSHDFGAGAVYDLFLLGGGGAGGGHGSTGGGGGAGGLLKVPGVVLSGLQEFTVGHGGTASSGLPGGDGGDTTIAGLTAKGGGGGGVTSATESVRNGRPGGCGGGGAARGNNPAAVGGKGVDGQGHDGGNGHPTNSCITGGGGGGVAGPGGDATGCSTGAGVGGPGVDLSEIVGTGYGDSGVFGKGGTADDGGWSPIANSGNGGNNTRDGDSGIIICAPPGSI